MDYVVINTHFGYCRKSVGMLMLSKIEERDSSIRAIALSAKIKCRFSFSISVQLKTI